MSRLKRAASLFLSILIVLQAPLSASANNTATPAAPATAANSAAAAGPPAYKPSEEVKTVFLNSLVNRVLRFERMNLALLKSREECFSYDPTPEICVNATDGVRSFVEGPQSYQRYIRQFLISYNVVDAELTTLMRRLYAQLEKYNNDGVAIPLDRFDPYDWDIEIPYQGSFADDVPDYEYSIKDYYSAIVESPRQLSVVDPNNPEEVITLPYDSSLNGLLKQYCTEALTEDKTQIDVANKWAAGRRVQFSQKINPQLCERFQFTFDQSSQTFSLAVQDKKGQTLPQLTGQDFTDFMYLFLSLGRYQADMRDDIHEMLTELIQRNPFVVLLPSTEGRKPNAQGHLLRNEEYREAFTKSRKYAEAYYKEMSKKEQDYKAGKLFEHEKLEFLSYQLIADHLLEFPSREMAQKTLLKGTDFKEVAQYLKGEYQNWRSTVETVEIGVSIVSTIICISNPNPFTKGVKALKTVRRIMRAAGARAKTIASYKRFVRGRFCLAVMPFSVSSYFVLTNWAEYKEMYGEIFAGMTSDASAGVDINGDGEITEKEKAETIKYGYHKRILREIEEMEPIQEEMFWNVLFSGFGLTGTVQVFLSGTMKLSKLTTNFLAQKWSSLKRIAYPTTTRQNQLMPNIYEDVQ